MEHPFSKESRIFLMYLGVWLVVALVHVFIVKITGSYDWAVVIADSLVFNILMLGFGMGVWFPVRYIDQSKGRTNTLLQFAVTGAVLVALWLIVGQIILKTVFAGMDLSEMFTNTALTIRAAVGTLQFLLLVMVYYMFIFFHELEEKNRAEERLNRLLRESELSTLKAQLNPHFLFNSLNSISSLTITNPDDAREMVNKLSEFFRYSLNRSDHKQLPLREELKHMARYLEIEKVRFGDKLQCELEVSQEAKDWLVPAMILQPVYENAVKYGVYESIEPITIRTLCRIDNDELEICVLNDFDADALKSKKGTGTGLSIIRERLQLLYGRNDLISSGSENGIFEVCMRIPRFNINK